MHFSSRSGQSGIFVVIACLLVIVIVALFGLVVGMGLTMWDRSNLQRAANAASLAAIQELSEKRGKPDWQQQVENRALELFTRNQPSWQDVSIPITDRFNIAFSYGRFYQRPPEGNSSICAAYPCLVGQTDLSDPQNINAVRMEVSTKSDKSLLAPFISLVSEQKTVLGSASTATMVKRCTSLLLDVSLSVAQETHYYRPDPLCFNVTNLYALAAKPYTSLFAVRFNNVAYEGFSRTKLDAWELYDYQPWNCKDDSIFQGNSNDPPADWPLQERTVWCSTRPSRHALILPWTNVDADNQFCGQNYRYSYPPNDPLYPKTHYRSDYTFRNTKFGPYFVDVFVNYGENGEGYYGPEPLNTFLHAFNSALLTLKSQQTQDDLVQAKAFTGEIRDEIPCQEESLCAIDSQERGYFSKNLDYLLQITNIKNRGTFSSTDPMTVVDDVVEPNFLTHGWFPVAGVDNVAGGTNLSEVLYETIEDLSAHCPAEAKKQILLATDGMMSCKYNPSTRERSCLPSFNLYREAEAELLGESLDAQGKYTLDPGRKSVLELLKEKEIALTVLLAGSYVEPHFINVERTPHLPPPASIYFDFVAASSLNLWNSFFSQASSTSDEEAYLQAGSEDGVIFRRPNKVLGRMAMESGGLWCPLQPKDPYGTYVNHMLTDAHRVNGAIQRYSILDYETPVVAAQCASLAVGYNPFMLMEPVEIH